MTDDSFNNCIMAMDEEFLPVDTSNVEKTGHMSLSSSNEGSLLQSQVLQDRSSSFDTLETITIPIVGYEVVEERARFTVYKLKIRNRNYGHYWFVFRRYTDFVRLHSKLKTDFPNSLLQLPRKKWFGDNFNEIFIEKRLMGLQAFIDSITQNEELMASEVVREFFCLDQPPNYIDSNGDNRVLFESLEDKIHHLRKQVLRREQDIESISIQLEKAQREISEFALYVRDAIKNCHNCRIHLQHQVDMLLTQRIQYEPIASTPTNNSYSIS